MSHEHNVVGIDDATIESLKSKHGECIRANTTRGQIVFRKPSKPEWFRFTDAVASDKSKSGRSAAMQRLCQDCMVWPVGENDRADLHRLNAAIEDKPGIVVAIAGELADLAGADADELDVGKL